MDSIKTSLLGDVHSGGGDIDSLLSNEANVIKQSVRRLHEPYERHRAHDLRAECYRRGIRPIKKGPNANDNKGGYVELLRKFDANGTTNTTGGPSFGTTLHQVSKRTDQETGDETIGDPSETQIISNLTNKRNIVIMPTQPETTPSTGELQGFYEGVPSNLLSMQYPPSTLGKSTLSTANNPTTDLEILSGIANSYTQNEVSADGQLCGNCRTVVTDQLMESIRLGKTKMKLEEWHKIAAQRDRDTHHLKEVLGILQDLRKTYRDTQMHGMTHDLLVELQDDIAFFRNLKERTKERMRQTLQEARERIHELNGTT